MHPTQLLTRTAQRGVLLFVTLTVGLAPGAPALAQEELGSLPQTEDFVFFPYADFSTVLPTAFSGTSVAVELEAEAHYTGYVWRRSVDVAGDRSIAVTVECPFVGVGWLRVRDPEAGSQAPALVEHRIRCGPVDVAAATSPEAPSMAMSALTTSTSVPLLPADVPG